MKGGRRVCAEYQDEGVVLRATDTTLCKKTSCHSSYTSVYSILTSHVTLKNQLFGYFPAFLPLVTT